MPLPWITRAGLLGLALTSLAAHAAADGRRWIADSNDEITALIYGTPESDDMVLNLTCERASKTLTVWFALQPGPPKPPATMPLAIASEGGRIQLTASGTHSDMDDSYMLEAKAPVTPELEKLISGSSKLSIHADNRVADLPLDDAALKGAAEVLQACRK